MTPQLLGPHALYYPFHLCHPDTLTRLLARFSTVHFRDFMSVRLTPTSGITAFQDRMGGTFPELLASGRLVQGYDVSGPMSPDLIGAIDQDLSDHEWRRHFHQALCRDRRFQRGLFDIQHNMQIGKTTVPGPAALLTLMDRKFSHESFTVQAIQTWSATPLILSEAYRFEYGFALLKTSASLAYTERLARQHHLQPVTDSPAHFELFEHMLRRERGRWANHLLVRQGY